MKISNIEWGIVEMEDGTIYKDVKIHPNGHRKWDWGETKTRHVPGIQIIDIEELLDNGSEIIILSKGYDCVLKTMSEVEEYLEENKIPYHILQTEEAVGLYNELIDDGNNVGALIHSTC